MKKKLLLIIFSITLLSACSPKLDTSNAQSLKESSEKIENSLNLTQQIWFKDAIVNCKTSDECDLSMYNGLSASDIIEEGRKLKLKRMMEKQNHSIQVIKKKLEEIDSLTKSTKEQQDIMPGLIENQKAAIKVIDNIHILNSKIQKQKDYFESYNIISFSVKNESEQSIKSVGTKCKLVSPGRSVPWIETSCNFTIDGGLEPGEVREMKLKPNMFSDLGKVTIPSDSEFIMEITFIESASGEKYLNKIKIDDLNTIESHINKVVDNFNAIHDIYNESLNKLTESENQFKTKCRDSISKRDDNLDKIYPNDIKGMLSNSQFEQDYLDQVEGLLKKYSEKAEPLEKENVELKKTINTIMNSWKE